MCRTVPCDLHQDVCNSSRNENIKKNWSLRYMWRSPKKQMFTECASFAFYSLCWVVDDHERWSSRNKVHSANIRFLGFATHLEIVRLKYIRGTPTNNDYARWEDRSCICLLFTCKVSIVVRMGRSNDSVATTHCKEIFSLALWLILPIRITVYHAV